MQRIYLNDNWYFARNYTEDLLNPEADLSELRKVRIPHSVCELSYSNFDEMSVQQLCGYRRSLIVEDAWRGGHLILTFEGAAHEAAVYVNGKLAMKHYGGYTAFSVDIVPFLADGREQVITVRLDSREKLNQPPFGSVTESLTYGGIYRDVYLDVKDEYYIEDIYTATPDVRTDEKILKAQIKLNAYTEGLRLAAHLDTWTEIPLEGEDLQHWENSGCAFQNVLSDLYSAGSDAMGCGYADSLCTDGGTSERWTVCRHEEGKSRIPGSCF